MIINISNILAALEHYKYILIFPIMIVEGPIITIVCGFLVYLGFLNALLVFPLLVLGDLIGDSFYYAVGRYSTKFAWTMKLMAFFGYNESQEKFLINHFEKHTLKTLLIAKISHGLGIPVQITAGIARVRFYTYLLIELLGTVPKTFLLLILGYYLGSSYQKINSYLHIYAFAVVAIFVLALLYTLFNKYLKQNYFK